MSNSYNIQVSVNITDASSGSAYMFAVPTGTTNETEIVNMLKLKELLPTHLVSLGDFEGFNQVNEMSGNIDEYLILSDKSTSSFQSNFEYDVYVYAIDMYKNRTVLKHPESPVLMTSETIVLAWTNLFVANSAATKFAEHRNLSVPDPVLNLTGNVFDFSKHGAGQANKLYIQGNVDMSEFIIDSVKVVVSETELSDAQIEDRATAHGLPVTDSVPIVVHQTTEATPTDIMFGKTYNVYSVMHDRGLNKKYIRHVTSVTTGTQPALQDVVVKIDEI